MGERIKFKIEKKFSDSLAISEIETGENSTKKCGKKVNINDLREGEIYEGLANNEYINFIFSIKNDKKEEKKVEQRKEENVVIPKAPEVPKSIWTDTKQDEILAQSTLKEAVNIAIASLGNKITLDAVEEYHKRLYQYMKNKKYISEKDTVSKTNVVEKIKSNDGISTIELSGDDI